MARIKAKNAQEILLADFQALVNDTERLLEHSATLAGDGAEDVRAKIQDSLLKARETLHGLLILRIKLEAEMIGLGFSPPPLVAHPDSTEQASASELP